MKKLEAAEIETKLQALAGWAEAAGALEKTYYFPDYHRVMTFVNAVAFEAHASDHHPDLGVHFDRVKVTFTTHDAGGVTSLDTDSASRVEQLFSRSR